MEWIEWQHWLVQLLCFRQFAFCLQMAKQQLLGYMLVQSNATNSIHFILCLLVWLLRRHLITQQCLQFWFAAAKAIKMQPLQRKQTNQTQSIIIQSIAANGIGCFAFNWLLHLWIRQLKSKPILFPLRNCWIK